MKIFKIRATEEYSDSFFNIFPAEDFVPDWYRKSPSKIKGESTELLISAPYSVTSTYKKCTPILDAITSGYVVALSADIEVILKDDGSPYIMWRTMRDIISFHSAEQWEGLPCPNGYFPFVYKWNNQFTINTPSGYSLLFTKPFNRFDLPFESVSGIVDTDAYDMPVNFPFFIKKGFTGIIPKGTPIAQIIPIKRESWGREHIEYDKDFHMIAIDRFRSTIKRSYKNNFWNRKIYK
jgi:hypothetical protein